jgi:hypothetical protein
MKIIACFFLVFYTLVGLNIVIAGFDGNCLLFQDVLELEGYLRYIKSDPNILDLTNSYKLNSSSDPLSVEYIKTNYDYTTSDSEILVKYFVSNKITPLANIPLSV